MGQCLSHSENTKGDEAGKAGPTKERVARHLAASPTPAAQPTSPTGQPVPTESELKASELCNSPSSASDETSTQPSSVNGTTDCHAARTSGPGARQLDVIESIPSEDRNAIGTRNSNSNQDMKPSENPKPNTDAPSNKKPGSLLPLNACVQAGPSAPPACSPVLGQPTVKPSWSSADPDEIVVNQGGCCGPIVRKEIDFSKLSFDQEALEHGMAGLPHDVVSYGAPRPANEDHRMATVRALRNMEVQQCPELDVILKVICRVWGAPSACVTLLDSDHVFICSAEGFPPAHRPWAIAMCPWMLLTPHPTAMAVGDLTQDARFAKSVHVAGGTRSYLTSPLVASNGHRLGAICFTDVKPRRFDAGDCRLMNNCAELAVRALEAHLNLAKRLGLPSPKARGRTRRACELREVNEDEPLQAHSGGLRGVRRKSAVEDDGTLMEEYCKQVRDVGDVTDSVVLLLDTRTPGWPILYVSPSWEELTGLDRLEAMGATLNDVMAHCSGDPRIVWEGVEREAAAGKPFVSPRVYVKSSPAITFYLSFRPAATDDIDDQTVTLGVPASVPQAASAATSKLFFARLHATPDPPANTRMHSHVASAIFTTGRRLPPSIAINPVQGLTEMFEGLSVGQVLGQGSYGTVYHAKWHGVDVAIKVQDMHIRSAKERERAEFEVGLGQRLHHVNIVRTLSHSSALLERPEGQLAIESGDSNLWNAGLQLAPLGYLMASTARQSTGMGAPESSACSASNLLLAGGAAGAEAAGPAFIPFFAGDHDPAAAKAVAAAAAAAAAAATGDDDETQPSLVNGSAAAVAATEKVNGATQPSSSAANASPALALYQKVSFSSGGGGGGPAGNRGQLNVVSASNNTVVCVALPSGAHVPLLRSKTRGAAALNAALPALSTLLAARGSSRSGGPGGGGPGGGGNSPLGYAVAPSSGASARNQAPMLGGTSGSPSAFSRPSALASSPQSKLTGEGSLSRPGSNPGGEGSTGDRQTGVGTNGIAYMPVFSDISAGGKGNNSGGGNGNGAEGGVGGDGEVVTHGLSPFGVDAAAAACDAAELAAVPVTAAGLSDTSGGGGGAPGVRMGETVGADVFGSSIHFCPDVSPFCSVPEVAGIGGGGGGGSDEPTRAATPITPDAAAEDTLAAATHPSAVHLEPESSAGAMEAATGAMVAAEGAMVAAEGSGGAINPFPLLVLMAATGTNGGAGGIDGAFTSTAGGVADTVQGAIEADLSGLSYPLDVRLWMVLEFMDKGSLQDAIDRGWLREGRTADHGPDYVAVLATASEVAAGLTYLHSHDVVHGDLSADNVLLQSVHQQQETTVDTSRKGNKGPGPDKSGRGFVAKISDFGLSMQLKRPDQAIKTGSYGTITHMAPEVLRESALSKAADVYSVGVLLWQMVTGSRPWAGLSHLQMSVEVGSNMRQLQWPGWVHGGVRALGQRCMAPKPKDRPAAAQLVEELTALMRQVPQYG